MENVMTTRVYRCSGLDLTFGGFQWFFLPIHPTHRFHGEKPPGANARKMGGHAGRPSHADEAIASPISPALLTK
ncbi:hypothetical protein Bsp3421_005355 [Burkholderia sp. FERM BP-3421]|uniref:hypothetical protein n=1 Tax=Burkholderia sp. FERM BP-3421 TaxID=1494466 RepID=UPI0023629B63|nr:hypothetical protein [Burkholderia sp. FERM BP-3421]WDD95191.1 hypothetical protein Bsp3421_005355 [Burkholderia sp. FERM BP-3421]